MTNLLSRLEWEVLQKEWFIEIVSVPPFLKDTCERITLRRDENYGLSAEVSGRHDVSIDPPEHGGPPGSTIVPFQIVGTNRYGNELFAVEQCHVTEVKNKLILNAEEKYVTQSTVCILCHQVNVKFRQKEDEQNWITEWYLNAPEVHNYACRSTKRTSTVDHVRRRFADDEKFGNYRGAGGESSSIDHLIINSDGRKCIVHAVPEELGPSWTRKLGIEYRAEFGWLPDKTEREAVAEIVGFVLGRHLLNIGSTDYNLMGYPISAFAISPWGKALSQSKTSCWPPMQLHPFGSGDSVEVLLNRLFPIYIARRDQFGLKDALWRYWIANELPVGTSVPLLANGVEIMAQFWFENNKSASRGVYLEKGKWDALLDGHIEEIAETLKDIQYADRILSRIKHSFQMGASDRLSIFFDEIGLNLGQPELEAIKSRNKMIHASIGVSDEEIQKAIQHTHAYRTLFHRVFLRLLEFDGKYVDYSSLGWIERQIDEPTDSSMPTSQTYRGSQ